MKRRVRSNISCEFENRFRPRLLLLRPPQPFCAKSSHADLTGGSSKRKGKTMRFSKFAACEELEPEVPLKNYNA